SRLGVERVQGVPAGADDRLVAFVGEERAPETGDGRLERVAPRVQAGEVDGHVRYAEGVGGRGEVVRRLDAPVVDQPLLKVAREHERALDVVWMRDLLQHEDETARRDLAVRLLPEGEARRMTPEELVLV